MGWHTVLRQIRHKCFLFVDLRIVSLGCGSGFLVDEIMRDHQVIVTLADFDGMLPTLD